MTGNGKTLSFTYNENGIRTTKTVNGVTTTYHLLGNAVTYESNGTDNIYYTYDPNGQLLSMNLSTRNPDGTWSQGVEYYYVRNAQNDIIGLLDNSGTEVVRYTYDSWGKLISTTGSLASTLGVKNPYRYRGYRYDAETGLYYLTGRYYDPQIGRFINADTADVLVASPMALTDKNLFAYCENNPVMFMDPSGYGKTYVIYYNNPGSGFETQAMNSPYYNKNSKDVYMIGVTSNQDFIDAWNSMSGTIDYVYLYLHGGTGILYFKGESLSFFGSQNFSDLNSKKVKKGVYLFSCHGGDGREGNNVAWMFSKLTISKVYACTGSVSYSKIFGKYYARKAWDWGIIKTFYYQKKYIFWGPTVAKSSAGQW